MASKVFRKLKAENDKKGIVPDKSNPYIRPKHRAIFERMKQGETITGAMIALSYAPKTVDRPTAITTTKSWQALMEEQLPEDHVAKRHRELLDARKYRTVYTGRGKNKREERVDDGVDPIVMKAVELAYKLRGRTKDEAPPADRPNIYNIFYQKNVQESVRAFEDSLKHSITYEIAGENASVAEDVTVSETGEDVRADDTGSVDAGTTAEAGGTEGGGDVRG